MQNEAPGTPVQKATATESYSVSEISARSPDLDAADFDALTDDIRTHGQLVPIWVRGDEVIDGRKRLAACERLGIAPLVMNLTPDQDAESLSRSLNLLRTHYTPSQRAMLAAKRATLRRGERPSNSKIVQLPDVALTAAQSAAEVGINATLVHRAKRIHREAAPEVVAAVEAGKLTLHAAAQIAELPKQEQPSAVARVVEAAKGKARNSPASVLRPGVKPIMRRHPEIPVVDQIGNALDSIEFCVEHIERRLSELGVPRDDWTKRFRCVRSALSRVITSMESRSEKAPLQG